MRKLVLLMLISMSLKSQVVQNTCQNQAWLNASSLSWTLGTMATPMTVGNGLIVCTGIGCDKEAGNFPSKCLNPQVSDTCQDGITHNTFEPIYGFDPGGQVGAFCFYTCDNLCAGVDTISISYPKDLTGGAILSEVMGIAVEFISPDNSGPNACQDNPNLPSGPPINAFNQCFSTQGTATNPFLTPKAPTNFNPPNFRTTGPFSVVSFNYNRLVPTTYLSTGGTPNTPDFTHQSSQASFLNPSSTGQTDVFTFTKITSTGVLTPPYFTQFTDQQGNINFDSFQANCILVFDKVTSTSGSIMKKRGLEY